MSRPASSLLNDVVIARRPLGRSGIQASILGFGTGDNAGLMVLGDAADQQHAVAVAIDAGINYFDTSPDYGRGRAEENLGRALRGKRERVLITTKVEIMPADRHRLAKKVEQSINESLRRLGTDYVDVLMIHNAPRLHNDWTRTTWAPLVENDFLGKGGALEGLQKVISAGKAKIGGIACEDAQPDALRAVISHPAVSLLNVWLNMLNPSSLLDANADTLKGPADYRGIARMAALHGVGIAGFRALGGGALMSAAANTFTRHPVAGGGFTRNADVYRREVELASKLVKRLDIDTTAAMAAIAYRFNISDPRISTTVAGFSELSHLQGAIQASAQGPLSPEEFTTILAAWHELFVRPTARKPLTTGTVMSTPSPSVPHSIVSDLSAYSTARISAVLDQLNIQGQCVGLVAQGAAHPRFCGRAFTVQFMPCGTPDARTPNGELDDYIEDIPSGCVIAIDNRGREDVSVWNRSTQTKAVARGAAAAVIDGAMEDATHTTPMFAACSRSIQARSGQNRVRVEAINLAIVLGGVRVECDDVILGDLDGVVVIPRDYLNIVLAKLNQQ